MKLKTKAFSVSLIGVVILLIVLFLFINPLLLERYRKLEESMISDNIKRMENGYESEINKLYRFVRDYAVWDDTYQFVQDHSQDYIDSNWMKDTFYSNNIEIIIYLDETNGIVYAQGYDVDKDEMVPVTNKIDIAVLDGFLLKEKTGIVRGKFEPVILASHRIYPTLENQSSNGTLITGVTMNQKFIEKLAGVVHLPLVLNERSDGLPGSEDAFEVIDKQSIRGMMYYPYENTSDVGEISFTLDRTIYQSGYQSLKLFYVIYALFSIVLTGIILILLDKHVLSRISNLSKEVKYIRVTQDLSRRIVAKGKDEIGELENGYNNMLDALTDSQEEIRYMAVTDNLTGLPNRKSFVDQLTMLVVREEPTTVMFLDIDLFKCINDSFGHHTGDSILITFANRLKTCIAEDGFVGRWGGDEFVVAIPKVDEGIISIIANNILIAVSEPVEIGSSSFKVTTSIGISQYPTDDTHVEKIIQNADIAMYEAKRSGKNRYKYYKFEFRTS